MMLSALTIALTGALAGLAAPLTLSATALAQPAPAMEPEAAPSLAATADPAMWRVADEDSEFILFGNFHFLPPGLDWRHEAMETAFADAEVVYFEMDGDNQAELAETGRLIQTEGRNPPGVSLSATLEQSDREKLSAICNQLGINLSQLETLRPWNAFLGLSVQFIVSQGFNPGAGVDRVLMTEAKLAGKDVRYFETLTQQIGFFSNLDAKTERDLLLITIREWDQQAEDFDDLFNAWAAADVDLLDQSLNGDMRDKAPVAYETLIVNRNIDWAEQLDEVLKAESGKGFVAVGAAHLVGDEFSLPALLAAKGYEVSRYGLEDAAPVAAPEAANDNEPSED